MSVSNMEDGSSGRIRGRRKQEVVIMKGMDGIYIWLDLGLRLPCQRQLC